MALDEHTGPEEGAASESVSDTAATQPRIVLGAEWTTLYGQAQHILPDAFGDAGQVRNLIDGGWGNPGHGKPFASPCDGTPLCTGGALSEALVRNEEVACLAFVGGRSNGRDIAASLYDRDKRYMLEMEGLNAYGIWEFSDWSSLAAQIRISISVRSSTRNRLRSFGSCIARHWGRGR